MFMNIEQAGNKLTTYSVTIWVHPALTVLYDNSNYQTAMLK